MTLGPFADALTASDWFAFLGVLVAAILGVLVAVWGQWVARRAANVERFDAALAGVIVALGKRATELDEWASPAEVAVVGSLGMRATRDARFGDAGGPVDIELQTAVEAAWLVAPGRKDRECMDALSAAVYNFKEGTVQWQIDSLARLAADIRAWRTGTLSPNHFRYGMETWSGAAFGVGARAKESAVEILGPAASKSDKAQQ
ncbi:hypothetical protein ACFQ58_08795 [Agromyces sp. NPDC056523]|uniref:hypothetical protein n=1 Tax=Agromyces sp. NPDC056523 TaxID=3345850 RepID=UPI00366C08D8